MGMANGKMMAFALLAENRYGYPGNHTDKLAKKSRTPTAQRWTEVLTDEDIQESVGIKRILLREDWDCEVSKM